MRESFYTLKEIVSILEKIGIKRGSVVLAQVDSSKYPRLVGNEQMLIDALKKVVGEEGCIIVPTFTENTLDPSCLDTRDIPYKEWNSYRKEMYGYDGKLSSVTCCPAFGNQFLKNTNVYRWSHPVYSFAYWGSFNKTSLTTKLNFPISFESTLKNFTENEGFNLLIGVDEQEAILIPALANLLNKGTIVVQRGKFQNVKRLPLKDFLNIKMDLPTKNELLKLCELKEIHNNKEIFKLLSLKDNA